MFLLRVQSILATLATKTFFARLSDIMKCLSRQRFVELASQWFNTISRQIGRKMPDSYLGVSSDLMKSIRAYFCLPREGTKERFQNAKALGKAKREKLIFAFPRTPCTATAAENAKKDWI